MAKSSKPAAKQRLASLKRVSANAVDKLTLIRPRRRKRRVGVRRTPRLWPRRKSTGSEALSPFRAQPPMRADPSRRASAPAHANGELYQALHAEFAHSLKMCRWMKLCAHIVMDSGKERGKRRVDYRC
eukprot:6197352-Pleurochrysis_carterae.AAC.2